MTAGKNADFASFLIFRKTQTVTRAHMNRKKLRPIAYSLIAVSTFFLAVGALLFRSAVVNGAVSDYNVPVSWLSALTSAIWPPSWSLFLLLLGVILVAGLTSFLFFRVPRGISVALLLLQAGIAFYCGGALGWYFIFRELDTYRFRMDAEKLGEYWFVFEAVAIWALATVLLAVMKIFAPSRVTLPH